MQDFSKFVPNVHFEQIPIKNLVSNQEYQRPLSPSQVERAIADFDLNQINPVKASRRNGINYVFIEQHTIEIVATVSGSRETPVWCMIYDSLDYRNEADIFDKADPDYEVYEQTLCISVMTVFNTFYTMVDGPFVSNRSAWRPCPPSN